VLLNCLDALKTAVEEITGEKIDTKTFSVIDNMNSVMPLLGFDS
jgi:hypothetical protein